MERRECEDDVDGSIIRTEVSDMGSKYGDTSSSRWGRMRRNAYAPCNQYSLIS